MSLAQIQDAIEGKLAAAGFSCVPGVINLAVALKDLPAAGLYFIGFDEDPRETQTATRLPRFRVDLMFSLADAVAFRAQMLNGIPAVYEAIRADRSLGGLVDTTEVTDGGVPEFVEASIPLAVKTLYIAVEYEEDA